jgi:hypothetical protein
VLRPLRAVLDYHLEGFSAGPGKTISRNGSCIVVITEIAIGAPC